MINEAYNINWQDGVKNIPDKFYDILIADPNYGINAPKMQMGQNLTRKRQGLTQTALAEKSGVRIAAISEFETGKREISTKNLKKILEVLNAKIEVQD